MKQVLPKLSDSTHFSKMEVAQMRVPTGGSTG